MQGFHILFFISVIYASEVYENNQEMSNLNDTMQPITNLFSECNELVSSDNEKTLSPIEGIYIADTNIMSNPSIIEDDELERILNTFFCSFLTEIISFFLYNISELRPTFLSIQNRLMSGQMNHLKLKSLLFSSSIEVKTRVMVKLFEINPESEEFLKENVIECCRGYLAFKGIPFENLSYSELKEKIYAIDPHLKSHSENLALGCDRKNNKMLKSLCGYLKIEGDEKIPFLHFYHTIYDLNLIFFSTLRSTLNPNLYPALDDIRALFSYSFDVVTRLFNFSISQILFDDPFDNSILFFPDVILVTGFIFSIFKIEQARKKCCIFQYDIFLLIQTILIELTKDSMAENGIRAMLMDLFQEFLGEINKKRKELKRVEMQSGNAFTFQSLKPFVKNFLKTVIQALNPIVSSYIQQITEEK